MKTLILMSDDRCLEFGVYKSYHTQVAMINKAYADWHRHDFIYVRPFIFFNYIGPYKSSFHLKSISFRHSSWAKLQVIYQKLCFSNYDRIVYIDSDCIFKNIQLSIDEYLQTFEKSKYKSDVIFLNNKPWNHEKPCAGFMIINNTKYARRFIKKWYNLNLKPYHLIHPWEQESLWRFFFCGKDYDLIDDWMFEEVSGQFLRHVGSNQAHLRISYFTDHLNSLFTEKKDVDKMRHTIKVERYNTLLSTIWI